ncbi:MAG: hypothetical protein HQL36_12175 [Alphaproteobacteria bacterium]|nr:hypothetical protein [Alphaproteobacteria bacterium]MBF0250215.1 hypothetical protein [Alphaproteobacteria bacterium]
MALPETNAHAVATSSNPKKRKAGIMPFLIIRADHSTALEKRDAQQN